MPNCDERKKSRAKRGPTKKKLLAVRVSELSTVRVLVIATDLGSLDAGKDLALVIVVLLL